MGIITRKEWGARYRDGVGFRPVGSLEKYLHHSVTAHLSESSTFLEDCAAVRTVEAIGQQRFGAGISYNFLAMPSGRVFEGSSVNRISYHSGGAPDGRPRNTLGVGICLVGNYDTHVLGARTRAAVVWLLQEGVRAGWWKDPAFTSAHRDFKATACPGRFAYSAFDAINAEARGQVARPVVPTGPDVPDVDPVGYAVWAGISRENAAAVQRYLREVTGDYRGDVDGLYGPRTVAAVKAYQVRQVYAPKLVREGLWTVYTQDHFEWVQLLQTSLNRWRSSMGRIRVDGDFGEVTAARVLDLQRRNLGGAYAAAGGRVADGVPGPVTCSMLRIRVHPGLSGERGRVRV